jgi:hypothetical protein
MEEKKEFLKIPFKHHFAYFFKTSLTFFFIFFNKFLTVISQSNSGSRYFCKKFTNYIQCLQVYYKR